MRLCTILLVLIALVNAQLPTFRPPQPRGRYAHCAFIYNNHMIVYGGRGYIGARSPLQTFGDVWAFDLKSKTWTEVSITNSARDSAGERSSHSCTVMTSPGSEGIPGYATMVVFGGMLGQRVSGQVQPAGDDAWILEMHGGDGQPLQAHWTRIEATAPAPRFDHSAVATSRGLLVFGGCLGASAFDDIWLLENPLGLSPAWRKIVLAPDALPPSPPTLANTSTDMPVRTTGPTRRCAHSAIPYLNGMIIFGGRYPIRTMSNFDSTWQTLADAWYFNLGAALDGESSDRVWRSIGHDSNNDVLLNRSDHSALALNGDLYIFGGLYTDVAEGTIYIMKDFLRFSIPTQLSARELDGFSSESAPGATVPLQATTERLKYGPIWRFDHTMVLAPTLSDPTGRNIGDLKDAPLLYGGGGGADIFSDIWTYDSASREWYEVAVMSEAIAAPSILTSLLFGTVGFALYTCIIVCLFMRKLARSRHQLGQLRDVEQGFGMATTRHARRGIPQEAIDALPRVHWSAASACAVDTEGKTVAEAKKTSSSITRPAELALEDVSSSSDEPRKDLSRTDNAAEVEMTRQSNSAEGTSKLAKPSSSAETSEPTKDKKAEEVGELCSVCLCEYEDADLLITLPCNHFFHEACITRWLRQDISCPHCRFNLLPARHMPGHPLSLRSPVPQSSIDTTANAQQQPVPATDGSVSVREQVAAHEDDPETTTSVEDSPTTPSTPSTLQA